MKRRAFLQTLGLSGIVSKVGAETMPIPKNDSIHHLVGSRIEDYKREKPIQYIKDNHWLDKSFDRWNGKFRGDVIVNYAENGTSYNILVYSRLEGRIEIDGHLLEQIRGVKRIQCELPTISFYIMERVNTYPKIIPKAYTELAELIIDDVSKSKEVL